MANKMEIAKRIKGLRKELGLSQAEFGKKIDILASSISRIESGENAPSDKTIRKICISFSVRRPWLIDGEGPMFMEKTEDDAIIDILFSSNDGTQTATKELVKAIAEFPDNNLASFTKGFFELIQTPILRNAVWTIEEGAAGHFLYLFGGSAEQIGRAAEITAQNIQSSCSLLTSAFDQYLKNKYIHSVEEYIQKAEIITTPEE